MIIESPFRSLTGPLLAYVDALKEVHPNDTITVVLPEFVPRAGGSTCSTTRPRCRLKAALLFHPGIVVTNVPYHLARRSAA